MTSNSVAVHETAVVWLVLALISITAFSVRLFAIVKFESVIHEFDPYFNFRATEVLAQSGIYAFWNWFDASSWYPLGRVAGQAMYPGVMVTAAALHWVLHLVGLPMEVRDVCVFLGPVFACLTALMVYALVRESCGWRSTALLAAYLVSTSPAYLSRSVGGSFDNEAVAITALMHAFYWIVRAFQRTSPLSAAVAALAYFYMACSWGGYVYITNIVALFVLVQMMLGRLQSGHHAVYLIFHCLGTSLVAMLPIVGMQAFKSGEHLASHAVAVLSMTVLLMKRRKTSFILRRRTLVPVGIGIAATVTFLLWSRVSQLAGRTLTLLDPTYAAKFVPIIASVSEHQPSTWFNMAFDMHSVVLAGAFPGLLTCLCPSWMGRSPSGQTFGLFLLAMYAVTAAYFACVMSRMTLIATPAVCIVASIGYTHLVVLLCGSIPTSSVSGLVSGEKYSSKLNVLKRPSKMPNDEESDTKAALHPRYWVVYPTVLLFWAMLVNVTLHSTWSSATVFSNPSVVIEQQMASDGARFVIDDFREAFSWLHHNTPPNAVVAAWWDYGYQASAMSHRITLVDNNTWNTRHIARVGLALSLPEAEAHAVLRYLDVDYIMVVFGGASAQTSDELNKMYWIARIVADEFPALDIDAFNSRESGTLEVKPEVASAAFKRTLCWALSYFRYPQHPYVHGMDYSRMDKVRDEIELTYFEEVYTTSQWLVRIYKVLDKDSGFTWDGVGLPSRD
ncbi:MAG: uncharacterized protein KVP18_002716 [Porospora cf. gigantea A]|uniref:uncharacterized protein n=1 Tax=Porospora cf. gigantea A TaxID=2853593 RepID=UPI00355AB459|nr:MAG: hypothetical protein KVP18_002716 [Porospora cf. gigantea A]